MNTMTVDEIVKKLRAAADTYYNTGKQSMGDEAYDALREQLEELDPENSFLREVGAPPKDKTVVLPFSMASLNKIKPGTGAVPSYVAKASTKTWLLSEKLDGISALWYNGKLYLRGDGQNGVDVTAFGAHVQGLKPCGEMAVRGELITPRGIVTGTLARSWVNGQLHQKVPIPEELRKIRFVGYEIVNQPLAPFAQFAALKKAGFFVPWTLLVNGKLGEDQLATRLQERREKSEYDTDGIVVSENIFVENPKTVKNPTHKVAFKMLLGDQCAETVVKVVEWNPSAQGFLIPRLQIEPVVVGTARIEFVTAHNARFVVVNKLGPGAKILIRRSGDVIPAVERVIQSCVEAAMPTGFVWKWLGDAADAAHIVLDKEKMGQTPKEVLQARLVLFAKTLDIAGMGPGIATKLVEAGLTTPGKVISAGEGKLVEVIGKGNGPKLQAQLAAVIGKTTEAQWMVASSVLPRGIGETKLKVLFDVEPDPRRWSSLPVLAGWSTDTMKELLKSLGEYGAWRARETPQIPYPILPVGGAAVAAKPPVAVKGSICFTGVRSKEMEAKLEAAGWKVVDTVSSKTTILVVPDGGAESTGKVKKAQDLGTVRIVEISKLAEATGVF
jgi:NAD-dependent DNA ligase